MKPGGGLQSTMTVLEWQSRWATFEKVHSFLVHDSVKCFRLATGFLLHAQLVAGARPDIAMHNWGQVHCDAWMAGFDTTIQDPSIFARLQGAGVSLPHCKSVCAVITQRRTSDCLAIDALGFACCCSAFQVETGGHRNNGHSCASRDAASEFSRWSNI